MKITHFTPGTGHFVCGSCLRDNTLVKALRMLGHDVTMVPLYLPFVLEEHDAGGDAPVFMGGINMYLRQQAPLLSVIPGMVRRALDSPRLLRWAASRSDMTDAAGHGAMMVSVLRGESGRQAAEIERMIESMPREHHPDVICLSNVMLIGLARRLRATFDAPVICSLQGEAPFLDALVEPHRTEAWSLIKDRVDDVAAFTSVSRHYGDLMQRRLGFDASRLHVVHNGIEIDDLAAPAAARSGDEPPPTIGYLARMCPDKGLHTLVDAFVILSERGVVPGLRLEVAGVLLDADKRYVDDLRRKLDRAGLAGKTRFRPNIDRDEKVAFLRSLSVLSVPATYGESFGLYVLEALAAGVPVVQPRHGAFPEVLEATGGGRLCEPDDPRSLADEIGGLLADRDAAVALGERGRAAVRERFTAQHMARVFENVCMMVAP